MSMLEKLNKWLTGEVVWSLSHLSHGGDQIGFVIRQRSGRHFLTLKAQQNEADLGPRIAEIPLNRADVTWICENLREAVAFADHADTQASTDSRQ